MISKNYRFNVEVRTKLDSFSIHLWELAQAIGVSEMTMTRWMRAELTEEKKKLIEEAVQRIIEERGEPEHE